MSLRINHNIQSVNGHRNMVKNDMAISKSLEKLSSGLRINRAADDAAGLIISEQMRAQITGLNTAISNTETAVSMVQTAEGALDEMNSLLNKARALALHAANEGANDTNQLTADQSELDNIISSITRIASNTQFGTKKILDGSLARSTINTAYVTSFSPTNIAAGTYDVTVSAAGAAGARTATTFGSVGTYTDVDTAIAALTNAANEAGLLNTSTIDIAGGATLSIQNGGTVLSVAVNAGTQWGEAVAALNTALADANAGYSVSVNASGQIAITATDKGTYSNGAVVRIASTSSPASYVQTQAVAGGTNVAVNNFGGQSWSVEGNRGLTLTGSAGASLTLASTATATTYTGALTVTNGALFQIGANYNQTTSVAIDSMKATDLGKGATGIASGKSLDSLRSEAWLTNGSAQNAIKVIDKAIDDVTNQRGALGAVQSNTLETNLNSARVTLENLTAAESAIRDVDFAAESAQFTRNSIMVQASTAMLAQANQLPQNVLKLLG